MSRVLFLSKKARERGTYPVKFTVKDSSALLVNAGNITSLYWWLTDFNGTVINSRSRVEISQANPFYVVLTDEDLQITDKTKGENNRLLTIRGTYNSTLGTDLPFTYSISFEVLNELVVDIDLLITTLDYTFVRDDVEMYV